ncbi:MAG: hypothetical protein WAM82_36775 [Thermoanaerobaculia bacterium]
MIILRLIFYGLVAFVPNGKTMDVFLPNARGSQWASDGCDIPEHFPALYVGATRCVQDMHRCGYSDILDLKLGLPKTGFRVSGSWLLQGSKISISLSGGALPPLKIVTDQRPAGVYVPQNRMEATDFSWVAKPASGSKIASSCLSGKPPCFTEGAMEITGGTVTTCHLVETENIPPMVCKYEFKTLVAGLSSADQPQALADAVAVDMQIAQGTKVLLTISSPNVPTYNIELTDNREIDIWMVNLPARTQTHSSCHDSKIDRHFELYYNLSERSGGLPIAFDKRPVPFLSAMGCVSSAVAQPPCPILEFDPIPGQPVPGDKPACATRQFAP